MANFNLNKVILGGRLTADVEIKQTPNGVPVAQFSIAVNRKPSKDGQTQTDFFNCTAWRNTAEVIGKYFGKAYNHSNCRNRTESFGQKKPCQNNIYDRCYQL